MKFGKILKSNLSLMAMIKIPFSLVLGCQQPFFQARVEVEKSVEENRSASNYQDWVTSGYTPEEVFSRARIAFASRDQMTLGEELCQALEALSDESLVLFDEEIQKEENQALLGSCRHYLKQRLDIYFARAQEQLARLSLASSIRNPTLPFRTFPLSIGSRGFFTTHADLPLHHVLLTFDDGPHLEYTAKIAHSLEEAGVRGMFFVVGNRVRAGASLLRELASKGHSIANHSMTHPCMGSCRNMPSATFHQSSQEITATQRLIFQTLGFADPFFRFPYGAYTQAIMNWTTQNQMVVFGWNVDSNDWRAGQSEWDVLRRTMEQLRRVQRGVLLLHDIHRRTALMVPHLLRELHRGGYTVVLFQPSPSSLRNDHPLLRVPIQP